MSTCIPWFLNLLGWPFKYPPYILEICSTLHHLLEYVGNAFKDYHPCCQFRFLAGADLLPFTGCKINFLVKFC